jgi:hypothetical protein
LALQGVEVAPQPFDLVDQGTHFGIVGRLGPDLSGNKEKPGHKDSQAQQARQGRKGEPAAVAGHRPNTGKAYRPGTDGMENSVTRCHGT